MRGHTQFELAKLVDMPVTVDLVRLGSGTPRDQIQDAVNMIASAWNQRVANFSLAVGEVVQLVDRDDLEEADDGLLDALWDAAKGFLEAGSAVLAGTPIVAKLGILGIEHLRSHQQTLERARLDADKHAFLAELARRATEMQLAQIADGGNQQIARLVDELDRDFLREAALNPKEDAGDAWQPGHRVVFGAQADFLRTLRTRAEAYTATVPPQSAFTAGFLVEWVNANHKRRRPGSPSSPRDGYIACKLELRRYGTSWLVLANGATLHCPSSEAVARTMMRTIEPFDVARVEVPVHVELTCPDDEDELPPFMQRAVPVTLRLNPYRKVEGAGWMQDVWDWLRTTTDQSAHQILARFTKLSG
jgi:hypothetical protein